MVTTLHWWQEWILFITTITKGIYPCTVGWKLYRERYLKRQENLYVSHFCCSLLCGYSTYYAILWQNHWSFHYQNYWWRILSEGGHGLNSLLLRNEEKQLVIPTLLRGKLIDDYVELPEATKGNLGHLKVALQDRVGIMEDPLAPSKQLNQRNQGL